MPVISISPTSGLAYGGVTVTTTATLIGAAANSAPRQSISIFNADSSATLYVGTNSAVTTSTGWVILPLTSLDLEIDSTVPVYGIVSSGSISVRYLEPRG